MNILVTGANGQLGNEMRRVSSTSSNQYIFTDVGELDITSRDSIRKMVNDNQIHVIVNCAAYTNVDKAEDDFATADLLNNKAVENLAIVAKETDATLIHVSTDYVFQGDRNVPCREDWETNPLGVYGKTKLAGEHSIQEVGCHYLIFRTAWLYSPYGKNFVKTMRQLTSDKDTLKVVFDQVGTPTYAGDLASVIYQVIEENQLYKEGIYHFSNEGVCSWYDFAKEICDLSGNVCDIQPCHSDEFPSKVKRPHFSVLDKTKVKAVVVSGLSNARKIMDEIKEGKADYQFVEIMACPGGCIMGGGQPIKNSKTRMTVDVAGKRAAAMYSIDERSTIRKSHENPILKQIYKDYIGKPGEHKAHELLHTHYVEREEYRI